MVIGEAVQRSLSSPICFVLGIVFAALAVTAFADGEAYRLYAGDSISVSVYSRPDLSGTFRLDERGQLIFPLIGPLNGNGRTTEQIRTSIANRLKVHVDGDVQVIVALHALGGAGEPARYRPVYIDGDIVKPGAYTYRPGMTVTIAVALAGGRHSVRSSGTLLGLSREQEQFEILLDTHRANIAREARLLAELAGKQSVVFPVDLETATVSSARVREILNNEHAIMDSRATLQALQADSLERRIKGLEQVIHEFESQKRSITSRRKLYEKKFKEIESLTTKGVLPKANLLSLQITATTLDQEARAADITIIQSRQTLDESRAQLANLPVEREAAITSELQTVQDSLTRSRIQFDQSLKRLAVLNSQTPPEAEPGVTDPPPRVSISRIAETVAKPPATHEADWDSPVLPGDVIQIPYPEFSAPDAFNGSLPRRVQTPQN